MSSNNRSNLCECGHSKKEHSPIAGVLKGCYHVEGVDREGFIVNCRCSNGF